MTDKELVDRLIQAAYDSGYYSGKGEDGQEHHRQAIARRQTLRVLLEQRLTATDVVALLREREMLLSRLQEIITFTARPLIPNRE